MGVAVPSTLTACCRLGSGDGLVAEMLMHRAAIDGRPAGAHVRARFAQGEAAVRNMAVPGNWRICVGIEMNCWRSTSNRNGSYYY